MGGGRIISRSLMTTGNKNSFQLGKYFFLNHIFSSAQTEWGHLANPQLAWHSYRQEPVAVRAVALHSSNSNAGMKQYESGRTQPLL
jgi:hypothetical protein